MNEVELSATGINCETKSKLHTRMQLERVCRNPVVSDVYAASDPNTIVRENIIQESLQTDKTPRSTNQTTMKANRHHFWRYFSLTVKCIKRIFQVMIELVASVETLCSGESHVVTIKSIWDNQVWGIKEAGPKWKIVRIIICIINKSTLLIQ